MILCPLKHCTAAYISDCQIQCLDGLRQSRALVFLHPLLFRRLLLLPRPQPRQRHRVDDQHGSVREAGGKVHDGKGVKHPQEGVHKNAAFDRLDLFDVVAANRILYGGDHRNQSDQAAVVGPDSEYYHQYQKQDHQVLVEFVLRHQVIPGRGERQRSDSGPGPEKYGGHAQKRALHRLEQKYPVPVVDTATGRHKKGGHERNTISND